ncbi:3-methyl-2-oxobutanoate hydroxymethyltransferase [Thermodesulfobacteriota bacterium]
MPRKTVNDIKRIANESKVTMLTAYDCLLSSILSSTDLDIILVGDSLASIFGGHENTLPITLDEMIYHTKAVMRGAKECMVITDMPFMSYHVSITETKKNAGRVIKETGAQGIKLEGGSDLVIGSIAALTDIEIPVMAHLGLTPQSINTLGGYKVQGKKADEAKKLLDDAKIVQQAGAFALVLECVPELLAKEITESIEIPTISIGAGKYCNGQVLVTQDLLGMYDKIRPKFVKRYKELGAQIKEAVNSFISEVKSEEFPSDEHSFK